MTFVEAAVEVLRRSGKPMNVPELVRTATRDKLLSVVGREPEVTMQNRLEELFANGGYHDDLVRVRPGVFGLKRYPTPAGAGEVAASEPLPTSAGGLKDPGLAQVAAGSRRSRGRRGRVGAEPTPVETEGAKTATAPSARPSLPALATLPKPGPIVSDLPPLHQLEIGDELAGDGVEGDAEPAQLTVLEDAPVHVDEDRQMRPAEILGDRQGRGRGRGGRGQNRRGEEPARQARNDRNSKKDKKEVNTNNEISKKKEGTAPSSKKNNLARNEKKDPKSLGPSPAPAGSTEPRLVPLVPATPPAPARTPAPPSNHPPVASPPAARPASPPPLAATPATASLTRTRLRGEIGRLCQRAFEAIEDGRGRGMNATQLSGQVGQMAPEALRRLRVSLLLEERWLENLGARPRVRSLGGGQYAAWGRKVDAEVSSAEAELLRRKAALVAATENAVARRLERLSTQNFELVCSLLLERQGWLRSEIVRRSEEVVYLGLWAGPQSSVRALASVRLGGAAVDRRAVGELRAGLLAKGFDVGILLSARRIDDEGQAELERGRGVEVLAQAQIAERLTALEIGVVGTARGEPVIDAGFWAELE